MKLKTKFSVWGIGSSIFIITISGVAWFSTSRLLYSTERVTHTYDVMLQAEQIQQRIEVLEYNQALCSILRDKNIFELFRNTMKVIDDGIVKLIESIWSPSQKEKLLEIQSILKNWEAKYKQSDYESTSKDRQNVAEDLKGRITSKDPDLEKIKEKLEDFQNAEGQLMSERKTIFANTMSNILMAIFMSSLVLLALNIVISFIFSKRIRDSLGKTSMRIKEIVDGSADLTKKLNPYSNDEIAEFIKIFNDFTSKLRKTVKEFQDEALVLNSYSKTLSDTSATLSNQAVATSSAAGHMFSAMEDLKQVTEANYVETGKYLRNNEENIADFIKNVNFNTNAKKADELVFEIRIISDTIIEINNRVQRIEDIIKTIGEISRQANILSVNASIQANKAGEYGQPFAVIASEIRALSLNSGNVLKNIVSELRETLNLSNKMALNIEKLDRSMKEYEKNTSSYNLHVLQQSQVLKDNNVAIQKLEESRKSQIEGLKMLANAMENIRDSSNFNASGARDLQNASQTLENLSKSLLAHSANFKT